MHPLTHRVLYRGQTYNFYANFLDEQTPLQRFNDSYPLYAIYDINGLEVQSGTATNLPQSGYYVVSFTPDLAASLSTEQQSWYIKWLFMTNSGRQVTFVERFDVVDEITIETATTAQQVIGIANKYIRTFVEVGVVPFDITLDVFPADTSNYEIPIVSGKTYNPNPATDAVHRVKNTETGGYVYYYNIPPTTLTENTQYIATWDITETAASVANTVIQKIQVVYFPVLIKISQLRMLIDKVQKQTGRVQAYEDADIIAYLTEGLKLVNSIFPITSYTETNVPSSLDFYWTIAAAWYGLNAQYLLEADVAFNFSGQTVTLDADRTGYLDTQLARLWDLLSTQLPKLKMKLVRARSLGTVSVRPYAGCNLVIAQPLLSSIERMLGFDLTSFFRSPYNR